MFSATAWESENETSLKRSRNKTKITHEHNPGEGRHEWTAQLMKKREWFLVTAKMLLGSKKEAFSASE